MSELPERRNVVLGITGSIAAYKSPEIARLLTTRGYQVRVVMTKAAHEFITPLTMQAVTGSPVLTNFWGEGEGNGIGHIELADWAEAVVVAPGTADFIAKLNAGFADDPLLAVALATRAPILVAPAMNSNMFENPTTQANIRALKDKGVSFVDPGEGELACGWNGTGRLAEPREIFHHVRRVLSSHDFTGKKILITTGPTREPIDPVRFISNRSSGKMGIALACEAFRRGASVTLIHGPIKVKVPEQVACIPVTTAEEMRKAVFSGIDGPLDPDIIIMAAAVADYRATETEPKKLKKGVTPKSVSLKENPDILKELGARRKGSRRPILVGFAVETGEVDELLSEVRRKLTSKKTDLMVGNFADEAFDLDTNRVWLIDRNGKQEEVATTFKSRVANKILDALLKL